MLPARSPYSLIQEDLWPDEWMILVSCMMLNCTSRKQVEKVLPLFMQNWPNASSLIVCNPDDLKNVIKPLGFANRRSAALIKMSLAYLKGEWSHAQELPGIGEYAARAWEMFCCNVTGYDPPVDHALVKYYHWRRENEEIIRQEKRQAEDPTSQEGEA